MFARMWRAFGANPGISSSEAFAEAQDTHGEDLSQGYLAPGMGAPAKPPASGGYLAPGMEPPPAQPSAGPPVAGAARSVNGSGGKSGGGGSRTKPGGWDGPIEQHPLRAAFAELQRLPAKLVEFFAWQRLASLRDVELGWQKLGDVKIAKAEKAVVERAEAPKLFPSHTWTTSL